MKKVIYLAVAVILCSFASINKSFAVIKSGYGIYTTYKSSPNNPNVLCELTTSYYYEYESTTGAITYFESSTHNSCDGIVVSRNGGGTFDMSGHCVTLYFTSCTSGDGQDPSYWCSTMDTPDYINGLIANINYNVDNPQH